MSYYHKEQHYYTVCVNVVPEAAGRGSVSAENGSIDQVKVWFNVTF